MRVLVIGASQGTGAICVKEALSRGHDVTAFARSPDKLQIENAKLTKYKGDFHQKASVENAVKNHDVVIITASSTSMKGFKEQPKYFSLGTEYVIEAMKKHHVQRLIVLSALGVGDSRNLMPFFVQKIMIDFLLKAPFSDHEVQEEQVRKSGLDWVIARPGRLTNGAAKKQYKKTSALEKVPMAISRADVADFLVEAVTNRSWDKTAVQLGG